MAKFRWTGDHAVNVTVGDRIVALEPGGFVEGDLSSPDNEHLIADGLLFDVDKRFGSGSAGTDSASQPLVAVTASEPAPAADKTAQPELSELSVPTTATTSSTTKTTEGGDS